MASGHASEDLWQGAIEAAFRESTEAMIDLAWLSPGYHVIDIGAGAGGQSIAAARRVGPTGFVLATDISAEALRVLLESAHACGVANLRIRQMPAEDLDFADQSFDAAICRNGLMHFEDHRRALLEIRRILKPNRRIALTVWTDAEENQFISLPISAALSFLDSSAPKPKDPFAFRSSTTLRKALSDAGFYEIALRRVGGQFVLASAKDAVRFHVERNMIVKQVLPALDSHQHVQFCETLERAFTAFESKGGFAAPCCQLVAAAARCT
jgi:ubiquinone/menaquinone biosynthesis C-methylase UbiE